MKVKKSLVEQIIREEVVNIKKLITLNEEKKKIVKKLQELYQETEIDEPPLREEEIPQDILAIIPQDQMGEFKQSVQQAKSQQVPQQGQTLEEGFGGALADKIKSFVNRLLSGLAPEKAQALIQDVQAKYGNMNFKQIFDTVKSKLKTMQLTEGNGLRNGIKAALLALSFCGAGVAAEVADKFAGEASSFTMSGNDAALGVGGTIIFMAALTSFLIMYIKDASKKQPVR